MSGGSNDPSPRSSTARRSPLPSTSSREIGNENGDNGDNGNGDDGNADSELDNNNEVCFVFFASLIPFAHVFSDILVSIYRRLRSLAVAVTVQMPMVQILNPSPPAPCITPIVSIILIITLLVVDCLPTRRTA